MYFSPSAIGFFTEPTLPDCKLVSDEVHNTIMDLVRTQGHTLIADVNGDPTTLPPPEPLPKTKERILEERLELLNKEYSEAVDYLRGTYPDAETKTWTLQIDDAKIYDAWRKKVAEVGAEAAGPQPITAFLTQLSEQRDLIGTGAGFDDLANRVLANNDIYVPSMATLTARRHKAEYDLRYSAAVAGIPEVEAVVWSFEITIEA